jgi:hypothetical protein
VALWRFRNDDGPEATSVTATPLAHEHRVAITKRLDALESIAQRCQSQAQGQCLEGYAQARALLRDLEDLFSEYLPGRIHLAEPLPRVRQHLGAMAGLDEYDLPEGSRSHLEEIMADIRRMRTFLPPAQ